MVLNETVYLRVNIQEGHPGLSSGRNCHIVLFWLNSNDDIGVIGGQRAEEGGATRWEGWRGSRGDRGGDTRGVVSGRFKVALVYVHS